METTTTPQAQPLAAPAQPANNSAAEYLKEAAVPPVQASDDAGLSDLPEPGNSPAPEPAVPYTPPPGAQPIYTPPAADTATPAVAQSQKVSGDYKKKVVRSYFRAEDRLSSTLCALVSGDMDDRALFRLDEPDIEELVNISEPYHDMIVDKLPPWVPLLMVWGEMKTQQIIKAGQLRKINKSNKEGREEEENIEKVGRSIPLTGNRNNFTLYSDGYYAKDRKGNYIKDRANNKRLLEKPDINDLDNILAIKANRNRDLLGKCFGWTEAEFERYNIPE